MTTTPGEWRKRSPAAYRGAQLAFSSPSSKHASPSDRSNHGALVAAHIAARTSAERLELPKRSISHDTWPLPPRRQSDRFAGGTVDKSHIGPLISRYEISTYQSPSLNSSNPADDSQRNQASATPSRSISISTDSSLSYSSATDELLPEVWRSNLQQTDPPGKLSAEPDSSDSVLTPSHRKKSLPTLSSSNVPTLSVSSLANAMVASSLAASRAPSPTLPPPPPPRRRSHQHLFHRTHSADQNGSRTPSPSKGIMRTSMRASVDAGADTAAKHKKSHLINKHPNKHHEGDRKRWRDQITEFERKRYEGVWAANKGLLVSYIQQHPLAVAPSGQSTAVNKVLNIIVRDIWSRSHLPAHVLEAIWDLVTPGDNRKAEMLGKGEFVVGMWLVDQALKGRKMPMKVSESVWFSARGLTGIKVKRQH